MINSEELFNTLIKYSKDIIDGKIRACKKHRQACIRFMSDLEKSEDDNYKYYFDCEELYRFYMWSKMFKHRVGILAKKPIELVPFQLFICGNIY